MTEPKQKPGKSRQDYGTPGDFIAAVERRFGRLAVDLAARADNAKAPTWIDEDADSLATATRWDGLCDRLLWLNPPFANIAPWAAKCLLHAEACAALGGRIFLLTPASVGANWYSAHVHQKALVLFLNGRITFEGTTDPYPKDCMLSVFGEVPGFEVWRWK